MNPDTDPPQPDEVAKAIEDMLTSGERGPDPWWRAGVEEWLEE